MADKKHSVWFHLFDVALNIIIILTIVGIIRTFFISPFQVEGNSMISTLEHKEYIIINKLAYHLGDPDRGDVVVFKPPTDKKKHYVKRVIGIPGDIVTLRGGNVYLRPNGGAEVQLDEQYLNSSNQGKTYQHPPSSGNISTRSYTVPEGGYFLLGDNRQGSLDSRSFDAKDPTVSSFVTKDDIKGRVWLVALPITKIHALEPPMYDL